MQFDFDSGPDKMKAKLNRTTNGSYISFSGVGPRGGWAGGPTIGDQYFDQLRALLVKDGQIALTVTDRERDTILAALRHYQQSTIIDPMIRDIANNNHDDPLSADEIDALCEDINCS